MERILSKHEAITPGKWMSVCLMIFCLTFLTAINYLLYPSDCSINGICAGMNNDQAEDFPPSGPTEEKSSTSGLTISEEMLHETHPHVNFNATNLIYMHHIAESEKLEIFHPEIILPPPKNQA